MIDNKAYKLLSGRIWCVNGNYNRIGNRARENMSKKSKNEEQNNIDNQDSINAEIPIGQGVDLTNSILGSNNEDEFYKALKEMYYQVLK